MKKLFAIFAILGLFAVAGVVSYEIDTNSSIISKAQAAEQTLVGKVMSLNHVVKGQDKTLTAEQAKKYVEKGQPIVLKVGSKVYFPHKADGNYAGKMLAEHATAKEVEVKGKVKVIHGIRVIMITEIKAK